MHYPTLPRSHIISGILEFLLIFNAPILYLVKIPFTRSLATYPVPPRHHFCIGFCERPPTEWLLARPHLQAVSDRLNRKTSVFTTTLGSVGSQPIKHGVTMRSTSFVKFSNHELFGTVTPIPQPR